LVSKKSNKGREKLDRNGKVISKERYQQKGMHADISSESESDEDFEFMEKSLQIKKGFDEMEQRLLIGII